MKIFKSVLTLSLLVLLAVACLDKDHFNFKNIQDTSWNPKLAVPLLKANVGVYNLFGATDSNAVSINGKDVSLIYQGKKASLKLDNIIEFKDVTTPPAPVFYTTSPTTLPDGIPLDSSLEKIVEIDLLSGRLTVSTTEPINQDQLTFTFLDIKNPQGQPLRVTVTAGNTKSTSLVNHKITPDNGKIRISLSGSAPGNCKAGIALSGLDYKSVTGELDFGEIRLPRDSFELYLFQNIAAKGDIFVENPILSINAENSIGFSLKPLLDDIKSVNPASGQVSFLNPRNVDPIKAGTAAGGSVKSTIRLDKDNSNLRDFVGLSPKYLNYSLGFKVDDNPAPPYKIYKNSFCELDMGLELPLKGRVSAFEVLDTIDMQITNDLSLIKEFLIKTYTDNGFPLDCRITILLMDEYKHLMLKEDGSPMVLLNEVFTAAAPVDANGIVTENNVISSDHKLLDEEVLASLPLAVHGQMRVSMQTTNNGTDIVKIQSDYNLEVKVGVKITGNISLIKQE